MADKSFPERYRKKMPPEFIDGVNSMDTDEIKQKILEAESHIYEIENEKEFNIKLQQAKEDLKLMTQPIAESKGIETAKIKYCLYVLETRGISL
jgi:tetrahydromethanopterin S-methyltransferase subunit A